ncbi:glutathione S-transferase 3-like isoform X2 [Watersipora subatra]
MSQKDKLVYFDLRARGEAIRMLYVLANRELVEDRHDPTQWKTIKPTLDLPLGQMPILTTEDGALCLSNTICRYIAKKFGLLGEGLWNETLNDLVVETFQEFLNHMVTKISSWKFRKWRPEPENSAEILEEVWHYLKKRLEYVEAIAEKKGKHHFILSDKIQLADVWVYTTLEWAKRIYPDAMEMTEWTKEFVAKFQSDPVMKKYLAERPETD